MTTTDDVPEHATSEYLTQRAKIWDDVDKEEMGAASRQYADQCVKKWEDAMREAEQKETFLQRLKQSPPAMVAFGVLGVASLFWVGSFFLPKKSSESTEATMKKLLPAPLKEKSQLMFSEKFEKAFDNLIREEGGYVNDPVDRGGETKYGISKKSYPQLNIKELTLDMAKNIYKKDFYDKMMLEHIKDDDVATEILEECVNMGRRTATYFLQIAVTTLGANIAMDGYMGRKTIDAVNDFHAHDILMMIKSLSVAHYLNLTHDYPPMQKYLKGWIKRVRQ